MNGFNADMLRTNPHTNDALRKTLTVADLRFTPPNVPLPILAEAAKNAFGLEGRMVPLAGERDQNFWLRPQEGSGYLLKVASPLEDPAQIDFQISALEHLAAHGEDLPVPRMIRTNDGALTVPIEYEEQDYSMRLLSFVPGRPLVSVPWEGDEVSRGVGALLGSLNRALASYSHPAQRHFMPWDIKNGLLESSQMVGEYLPADLVKACMPEIARLAETSLPKIRAMPHQVIHNDAHTGNVIVDPEENVRVCGLIDFGDLVAGPLVQDMAISLSSLFESSDDPVATTVAFLKGYSSVSRLPVGQLPYLYDAILARQILTVELLNFRVWHDLPGSTELAASDLPRSIEALRNQLAANSSDFTCRILDAAGKMD